VTRAARRPEVCADVTVRFNGTVVDARRLHGSIKSAATPLTLGVLAIVAGITAATLTSVTVAGALIGAGIVATVIGAHRRADPCRHTFWVGPAADVDLPLQRPGMPDRLAAVRIRGHDVEILPPPGFSLRGDHSVGPPVLLGPRNRLVLSDNEIEIDVQRGAPLPRPALLRLDARFAGGLVAAALTVGGTIALAHFVAPASLSISVPTSHTAYGVVGDP